MLIFIGSLLLVVIIIFEFSLIYGCYYFTRYKSTNTYEEAILSSLPSIDQSTKPLIQL